MATTSLKTIVFLGSARNKPAFWGGDIRLGDRVTNWVKKTLADRQGTLGDLKITHHVTIVDPVDVFAEDGALGMISAGELNTTTFMMKADDLPTKTKELMETIRNADCYLIRGAMSIQIMCHELGCLPVSKLVGIPTVADLFQEDGTPKDPENRMLAQLPALLDQLEWMAVAMKNQREKTGTF